MDQEQLQDWINLSMVGNSIAMDWYAITHDKPLPSQSVLERTIGADLTRFPIFRDGPGVSVGLGSGTTILIIGVVGVGLFLLLR